jgi:hypothetical protein
VDAGVGASLVSMHGGTFGAQLSHPSLADPLNQKFCSFVANLCHHFGEAIASPLSFHFGRPV